MQQSKKTAPEAEAQGSGGFRLKAQGGIVQLELFQSVPQIPVFGTVRRINTGKHHRIHLPVARQRLSAGIVSIGHCVAHLGVPNALDGSGNITNLSSLQHPGVDMGSGIHIAGFHHSKFRTGCHQPDPVADAHGSFLDPDVNDNALVCIIVAVKNQCLQRRSRIPLGGRNVRNDALQHLLDVDAHFRRNPGRVHGRNADNILHLCSHPFRIRRGQINLVDHRHQLQIMLQRQIGVGKGLGLDALGSIHHQNCPLAGCQGTGYLIVKVHMARGVDQIEAVLLTVPGTIAEPYRPCLDGNAPFTLDVHIVQQLLLHIPLRNRIGFFQDPVRQGGLAVVNVGDDTKIANILVCQGVTSMPAYSDRSVMTCSSTGNAWS